MDRGIGVQQLVYVHADERQASAIIPYYQFTIKVAHLSLWVILGSFFGAHGRIFLHDKARFFACGSCSR